MCEPRHRSGALLWPLSWLPASLQRFLVAVCDTLFQALGPGASYATRFSALTILCSLAEVFPDVQGEAPVGRSRGWGASGMQASCCLGVVLWRTQRLGRGSSALHSIYPVPQRPQLLPSGFLLGISEQRWWP